VTAKTRKLITRTLAAVRTAAQSARLLLADALTVSAETLVRLAARTASYTADQINKAVELIEDGGIHPLRPGIWLTVSTDGIRTHRTTASACTCEAGVKGIRCYHNVAVRALEVA
jgi:hypothetical protein